MCSFINTLLSMGTATYTIYYNITHIPYTVFWMESAILKHMIGDTFISKKISGTVNIIWALVVPLCVLYFPAMFLIIFITKLVTVELWHFIHPFLKYLVKGFYKNSHSSVFNYKKMADVRWKGDFRCWKKVRSGQNNKYSRPLIVWQSIESDSESQNIQMTCYN